MMSPRQVSDNRASDPFKLRQTPLRIIHFIANFLRIWSVYSMYHYLSLSGASVVLFIFSCVATSAVILLVLQKPWRGRPLSNAQVIPSMINGAITALYFILWVKGVKSCGPLRAVLGEYSGAVLGVLSATLYRHQVHIWRKVGGLIAMLVSFYLLSKGWAMATYSPLYILQDGLDSKVGNESGLWLKDMAVPICAGILSAVRRVIARRVSLKNQMKRRLHAVTIASATCFMFPVAMWDVILGKAPDSSRELPLSVWPYFSTIAFGVILIFYIESIAEERLHMVFSSPRHLMVAGGSVILLEILYKMDFSLAGFLVCCAILGCGIHEATSLGRIQRDSSSALDLSEGPPGDQIQMSSLPT
ncbi:hypothetical protein AKJ16_DCAP17013 [Drosera capensis]